MPELAEPVSTRSRSGVNKIQLTRSMNITFHENIDTSNSIQLNLLIFIVPPVTHFRHISPPRVILFVTFCKDDVFIEACCQSAPLLRFNPRVIVKTTLDIAAVLVSMEPDVCESCQGWHLERNSD